MSGKIQTNERERVLARAIYADFNGIEKCSLDATTCRLNLTGYGTLASLSAAGVKLVGGEVIRFFDSDGLSLIGRVRFDAASTSRNCSGWFAYFDEADVNESIEHAHDFGTHLCFSCRANLKEYLDKVGRQYKEHCPFCGTPVMFPLLPP